MNLPRRLRLLTWNIWFGPRKDRARMAAVLAEIARLDPDVVALQEVTPALLTFLEASDSPLKMGYHRLDPLPETSYFEVLYSRTVPGADSSRLPYTITSMGRGCTVVHLDAAGLVVGTTHLESLDAPVTRERQLRQALEFLQQFPVRNRILCGDMNLRHGQRVDHVLGTAWSDPWTVLHPDDPGLTRDASTNPMTADPLHDRLDRFFLSCTDYEPVRIERVGTEPVAGDPALYPSDHFGVFLEVARK